MPKEHQPFSRHSSPFSPWDCSDAGETDEHHDCARQTRPETPVLGSHSRICRRSAPRRHEPAWDCSQAQRRGRTDAQRRRPMASLVRRRTPPHAWRAGNAESEVYFVPGTARSHRPHPTRGAGDRAHRKGRHVLPIRENSQTRADEKVSVRRGRCGDLFSSLLQCREGHRQTGSNGPAVRRCRCTEAPTTRSAEIGRSFVRQRCPRSCSAGWCSSGTPVPFLHSPRERRSRCRRQG